LIFECHDLARVRTSVAIFVGIEFRVVGHNTLRQDRSRTGSSADRALRNPTKTHRAFVKCVGPLSVPMSGTPRIRRGIGNLRGDLMPLKLRPTQRLVGCRPNPQTRGGPDNLRWFWSLTVNGAAVVGSRRQSIAQRRRERIMAAWGHMQARTQKEGPGE
jgi:hypothetical protein